MPGLHLVMYFRTSSTKMTGKDSQSTASHSEAFSGVTENMAAAGGTYRMKACSAIDSAMDPSSHRLPHGGSCSPHHIHNQAPTGLSFVGKPLCTYKEGELHPRDMMFLSQHDGICGPVASTPSPRPLLTDPCCHKGPP